MRQWKKAIGVPLAGLVVFSMVNCGKQPKADPEAASVTNNIQLKYDVKTESTSKLVLKYSLVNNSSADIYLFTPLTDYRGQQFVGIPGRVYINWDNNTLNLSKRLWNIPEGLSVYMPEVPLLTRLMAGESYSETLTLPLPLLVNYPYRGAETIKPGLEQRMDTKTTESIVFSLGYVAPKTSADREEIKPSGASKLFEISYGAAQTRQIILKGPPVNCHVSVKG